MGKYMCAKIHISARVNLVLSTGFLIGRSQLRFVGPSPWNLLNTPASERERRSGKYGKLLRELQTRTNIAKEKPEHLYSPTWVLNFQKGNSFECVTLLVSLLLGQGYNAFVVSGYASREQVLCNMTRRTCPYLPKIEQAPPPMEKPKIIKYQLKSPPDFRSQLLLELEAREKAKAEAELQQQEEGSYDPKEFERPQPDKYFGQRIHAWVVILPNDKDVRNQEIIEPIFLEPSSGTFYNPADEETNLLYLGVESIWNDQNYWVNMQPRENGCAKINWDLSKIEFWEHLLPGEPRKNTEEIEEDVVIKQEKHLDMPASYVSEIRINSLDFERRYPGGSKTILYKKAKVELYAPFSETNSLIQRVTVYEDYEYTTPVESYEKYLNRVDCLTESRKNFTTGIFTDFFERGRPDHCKTHRYLASNSDSINNERTIEFYDSVQFNGLSRIEMSPLYLTQHYVDREDFVYYRHAEFLIDKNKTVDDIQSRHILKIIEKYHRNKDIPASKDMAEREFAVIGKEICIKFHYEQDRITQATRTFIKPSIADRGDHLIFDSTMTHGYNPDPNAPPEKNLDLFYALDKHLKDEDRSILQIRNAEDDVAAFLRRRADENLNPLTVSLFDKNRIAETTIELDTKRIRRSNQREIMQEMNDLGPYLARIGNPTHISKTEAYLLRDDCLSDFKQTSVDKANRILHMIDDQMMELEKMQTLLTQTVDLSQMEKEEILAKINEISFNMDMLETYLNWHRNVVPQRYRVLIDRLLRNPHLQILQKY
ncbi:PREDICTED: coiled-coil domain-containing protein lobo homolog [Acromyrmex echinatior]|uniref:coiled-coil domain-containing protein lobo homolog n=1 Tax=Acromyrmex echinatior TaxID=103372 RepID=UPI000580CBDF|nr:PREDICTED: coiled-coil domain-containing protein lobo homolog [Acromyrmex echinatior]